MSKMELKGTYRLGYVIDGFWNKLLDDYCFLLVSFHGSTIKTTLQFKAPNSFLESVTQTSKISETFEYGITTSPVKFEINVKGKSIGLGKGWKGGYGFKWVGEKIWLEERDGGTSVYYRINNE